MSEANPEFLTVRELAELLRVKERKIYALAASGEIPCSRATGKLIFRRADVDAWVTSRSSGAPVPGPAAERPLVLVGSHDPLLDWALRNSRCGLASFFDGSLDGIERLRKGEAVAAGIHIYDAAADDWNRRCVETELAGQPVVLLEWAWRDRGIIVAEGNPAGVAGLRDLANLRFAPRQPEAGSQLLFEALTAREGIGAAGIRKIDDVARSEGDVAVAIAEDKADAGFGLESIARQYRLGFVPLMRERYDIVVYRRAYFDPAFQAFVEFCRTDGFRARAAELGGYDLSGFGRVHHNAP